MTSPICHPASPSTPGTPSPTRRSGSPGSPPHRQISRVTDVTSRGRSDDAADGHPARGDAICMLPGWRQSDGARWEKRLAEQHGLRVIDYETDGLPEAAAA
jgi:hypothetical protein